MAEVIKGIVDEFMVVLGSVLLAVTGYRGVIAYLREDEAGVWKAIFYAFIAGGLIFSGGDLQDIIRSTWNGIVG
jgi:hypothetical protein